jgi:RNA polymerase II C-terminal domain phosphatase-like 3/4
LPTALSAAFAACFCPLRQVLRGVTLVFTRVIPLEMEPASHPLWHLAESFGAGCSGALDDATTHVIAGASGTEKVLAARGMGKWVVTPAWLECSCILWKRAHEERFLVPL